MKTATIVFILFLFGFWNNLHAQTCPNTIKVGTNCYSGVNCSPSCHTTNCCHNCPGVVDVVGFETYAKRVLVQEWIGCWGAQTGGMNSLEAGAVAIRSYAIRRSSNLSSCHGSDYDICSTTCCQVYSTTQSTYTDIGVDNTTNYVMVNNSSAIQLTEYAAEQNSLGGACGDGNIGDGSSWPCRSDGPCTGQTYNGHGRGMCQNGSARWATGLDLNQSSCTWLNSHGYGTKTWQQILSHYYPNWQLTQCSTTPYCSGTTHFTECYWAFDDGSGSSNYANNSDCKWLIEPPGATSIELDFTGFDIEDGSDYLYIYDGSSTTDPLLGSYTGSSLPSTITSTGGEMLLHFVTNGTGTAPGWTVYYTCSDDPDDCNISSMIPSSVHRNPAPFSDEIVINAQDECEYEINKPLPECDFVNITSPSGLTGTTNQWGQAVIDYSVEANNSSNSRSCTFTINGESFTINQGGCEPLLNQTSVNLPSSGGNGTFEVDDYSPCSWSLSLNNCSWVNLSQTSGSGIESISYSVSENTSTEIRVCEINVGNETLVITQEGTDPPPDCTYGLSSYSEDFDTSGGYGSFNVITLDHCNWDVTTNDPWINLSTHTGTGNGQVNYTVDSCSEHDRTGTIDIEDEVFIITQSCETDENGCDLPTPEIIVNNCDLSTDHVDAVVYQWYLNGNPVGVNSRFHTAEDPGYYYVTISDNGCSEQSSDVYVDCATSINDIDHKSSNVEIYPNPNEGIFIVKLNNYFQSDIELSLIDALGREVYKSVPDITSDQYKHIIDGPYPKGVYFLRVNENTQARHFIVIVN